MNGSFTGHAESKKIVFKLNGETGYYERVSAPIGFEKIPTELKVENTQRREHIRADFICRGRIKNGNYTFFTGLLPVEGSPYIFFGDHYHPNESQKNSFVLFQFSPGNEYMTINYFNHFKVYPNKRGKFISDFLKRIS
jgi:hypothetical protein